MPFALRLPRHLYDAMVTHALAERPNECCGLLAGHLKDAGAGDQVGEALESYPLVNVLASPVEYESEPRAMFDAVRDMRRRGLEVLAVYHSHPTSPPVPSRKDRQRNYSPDVMNLIVSLARAEPEMRAWWLTAEGQTQAEWSYGEDGAAHGIG